MKALFFDGSLKIMEIPKPRPGKNEVLIRIIYSAICNTDLEIVKGYMGFKGVLGHEFVGKVVSSESPLTGKMVVGEINCSCGYCYLCQTGRKSHCPNRTVLGIAGHQGIFADFVVLPLENLHVVPEGLSPEKAVFTEPLAAAVEIMEQINIKPSSQVFIFGAGKLGLLIAQVFRLNGSPYTLFDINRIKVSQAEKMGLKSMLLGNLHPEAKAEVCIDCSGSQEGIKTAMSHLYPRGKLVLKTTVAEPEKIDLNQIVINELEIIGSRCGPFEPALQLISQGLVNPEPLISKVFPFKDILKAFDYARKPNSLKVLIKH
jgi:threonine dehydrogenase-like Zn-dependent dehydrogenase